MRATALRWQDPTLPVRLRGRAPARIDDNGCDRLVVGTPGLTCGIVGTKPALIAFTDRVRRRSAGQGTYTNVGHGESEKRAAVDHCRRPYRRADPRTPHHAGSDPASTRRNDRGNHQQAQKYERGINRVSAGRLFEIARALSTPITYFYEGIGEEGPRQITPHQRMSPRSPGTLPRSGTRSIKRR